MTFRIALLAWAFFASVTIHAGCGGDECTRAEDHRAECTPMPITSSASGGDAMMLSCTGVLLCQSQCVNQFSCQQIQGNDPKYTSCLAACQGK
jgi:hypothetical protein